MRWTPNALGFDVDASESTMMVVNPNYDGPSCPAGATVLDRRTDPLR